MARKECIGGRPMVAQRLIVNETDRKTALRRSLRGAMHPTAHNVRRVTMHYALCTHPSALGPFPSVLNKKPPAGGFLSGSVSRVLSLKAIICLGLPLPAGSSHPSDMRPANVHCCIRSVLLRVGFTWPHSLLCAGELLPRLSILTAKAAVSFCCTFPKVTLGGR